MTVTLDAVSPSSTGAEDINTVTWSHTASGSNRAVLVACVHTMDNPTSRPMTAKYNGVTMTSLGIAKSNNGTDGFCEMWGLVNPPSGSSTVLVTDTTSGHPMLAAAISFEGVDQSSPFGTAVVGFGDNSAGAAPITMTVTSASGDMVADVVCYGSPIDSSNQTLAWSNNFAQTSAAGNGAGSTAAGASSVVMSYAAAALDWWGGVAVNVKAAAGGSSPVSFGGGFFA